MYTKCNTTCIPNVWPDVYQMYDQMYTKCMTKFMPNVWPNVWTHIFPHRFGDLIFSHIVSFSPPRWGSIFGSILHYFGVTFRAQFLHRFVSSVVNGFGPLFGSFVDALLIQTPLPYRTSRPLVFNDGVAFCAEFNVFAPPSFSWFPSCFGIDVCFSCSSFVDTIFP